MNITRSQVRQIVNELASTGHQNWTVTIKNNVVVFDIPECLNKWFKKTVKNHGLSFGFTYTVQF